MKRDTVLSNWNKLLILVASLTALISVATLAGLADSSAPLVLARGDEIWKTTLGDMPLVARLLCSLIFAVPSLLWLLIVIQIIMLSLLYRKSIFFELANARCFVRMGLMLMLMGIASMAVLPGIGYVLFAQGVSPFLPDMTLLSILDPDLILAGVFFVVLGKIMERAIELQESDKLTI